MTQINSFASRFAHCTSIQPKPSAEEDPAAVWGFLGGVVFGFAVGSFWAGLIFGIVLAAVLAKE